MEEKSNPIKKKSNPIKKKIKKLEHELQKSREDFTNIVERSDTGILIVDRKGIIKFMNPASENLFKRKSKDLLGSEFGFAIGGNKKIEIDIWRGDKTFGVGEMSSTKTEWDKKEALLLFIRDITESKNIEKNLRELSLELHEKNMDLESYAYTVAHDLKNPVGVIFGIAELLCTDDELTKDEIKEFSSDIYETSRNLTSIINELLLFASLQKTEINSKELDMENIVAEAIEHIIPKKEHHNIEITFSNKWLTSVGYAPWVKEVWKNYISNAVKYGGNPLKIEFGCDPIELNLNQKSIKYWIRDFGPGISQQNQKLLFKKFERLNQVKVTGHGLGLSIVKRIVEKLDGTTGLNSELGKGSTFYFTLPCEKSIPKSTTDFYSIT